MVSLFPFLVRELSVERIKLNVKDSAVNDGQTY